MFCDRFFSFLNYKDNIKLNRKIFVEIKDLRSIYDFFKFLKIRFLSFHGEFLIFMWKWDYIGIKIWFYIRHFTNFILRNKLIV